MSPYLRAFEAYHADNPSPAVPWTVAIDLHLQRGHVTSTDRVFLLAREVDPNADAETLEDLNHYVPGSNCWHVWIAAGSVVECLKIARRHGAGKISWHRFHSRFTRRFELKRVTKT
jgi:hypothetical protein